MNIVMLKGLVGMMPQRSIDHNGEDVLLFTLCTKNRIKENNKWVQMPSQWHNIVARGWHATFPVQEGDVLMVRGEIRYRKYTDTDGNNRSISEIHVHELFFIKSLDLTSLS